MNERMIFLDGKMVKGGAALIDALAPGTIQRKGVFETMRLGGGKIFAWEDHLRRLSRGLKALGIPQPFSKARWENYLEETLRSNRLNNARIRLAVWQEGQCLRTAIVGQTFNYSEDDYKKGFKAVISNIRRKKNPFSHIKSLDYVCFRRAFQEAQVRGYDEAILLNNRHELVEGSRSNIFLIKRGVLHTPAVRCGCLNGITRQAVLRCARQAGIPCRAGGMAARRLDQADEAFLTNALIGVMPLTRVGTRTIGQGKMGPLTQQLMEAYRVEISRRASFSPHC